MASRLSRLTAQFKPLGIDALFVSDPVNIRYLTGYKAEDAWLLVSRKKVFYITDFRYLEHVRRSLRDVQVVQFKDSLFQTAADLAPKGTLGFEENHLTYQQFTRLSQCGKGRAMLKPVSGAVEALRIIKDQEEVSLIRKAVALNLQGFRDIRSFIKPGVSEREIFFRLEGISRKRQAGFSFPPIVASGPNSAFPHARVTDRVLKAGEPLLLDFGLEQNGYKSDLTRMFFLGKMTHSFGKVLAIIKEAQEAAFRVIKPGVPAKAVDAAARNYLAGHALDKHFGHSLGHGVGLNIHEMPSLSTKSGVILAENMVITVEPGVYFSGKYGVRQEEMVLVTKNGCEVLSGNRDH